MHGIAVLLEYDSLADAGTNSGAAAADVDGRSHPLVTFDELFKDVASAKHSKSNMRVENFAASSARSKMESGHIVVVAAASTRCFTPEARHLQSVSFGAEEEGEGEGKPEHVVATSSSLRLLAAPMEIGGRCRENRRTSLALVSARAPLAFSQSSILPNLALLA